MLITLGHPADHAGIALLRNRNFALLFAGQGVSRLGDGLYVAVVAWLAWSLTHAVGAVALVTMAANAPTFVVTLIGASYADRYDRRRLMIGTDLSRGMLVGVAALLPASCDTSRDQRRHPRQGRYPRPGPHQSRLPRQAGLLPRER